MNHAGTLRLFVDEVVIHVRGGRGGDGCVSFRREKYVPKGGPDGGDGGHGGSVILCARAGLDTLLDLTGRHHWHAENGAPGTGAKCHGKRGQNLVVDVPVGTLVYDADTGRLLKDLVQDGQTVRVAPGGRGGRGNTHFANSVNQAPLEAQPGRPGRERHLRLELKLIADVGFVGLPNAGKSTLLARLTRARPKVAAYPFTTREPHLGILELPGFRRMVLADLPGLIEGAHEGAGLGDIFLRHIERTRLIVHLVDLCPPEGSPTPTEAYRIIRAELEKYSPTLAAKHEIVVGNKMDITGADESLATLEADIGRPALRLSGATGAGIRELAEAMWSVAAEIKASEAAQRQERIDSGAPELAGVFDSEEEGDAPEFDDVPAGAWDSPRLDHGSPRSRRGARDPWGGRDPFAEGDSSTPIGENADDAAPPARDSGPEGHPERSDPE